MKRSWQDHLLRGLFIVAGIAAAAVFAAKGQADALPPLALGGLVGSSLIAAFQGQRD